MKFILLIFLVVYSFYSGHSQSHLSDSAAKRQKEMMDIVMAKPKVQIKTIGIFVYDGFNTLDALGPFHILSQLMGTKVFLISKTRGLVKNQSGLKIEVDTSMAQVKQLDMLLIPGGAVATFMQTQDTAVLKWILDIDKTTTYTTSVCTGAWILGATNLLQGKNATTNWYRADEMLRRYGANFKQERWVKDGKYWTSAGVTAGLDMSLAIINEIMGEKYTKGVMLDLEYDPHPPFNAGSVSKTEPIIYELMKSMYDRALLPLINK